MGQAKWSGRKGGEEMSKVLKGGTWVSDHVYVVTATDYDTEGKDVLMVIAFDNEKEANDRIAVLKLAIRMGRAATNTEWPEGVKEWGMHVLMRCEFNVVKVRFGSHWGKKAK